MCVPTTEPVTVSIRKRASIGGLTILTYGADQVPDAENATQICTKTTEWFHCTAAIIREVRNVCGFLPLSYAPSHITQQLDFLERSSAGIISSVNRWASTHSEHATGTTFWSYAVQSMEQLIQAHAANVILLVLELYPMLDGQALLAIDLDRPVLAAELRRLSHAVRSIVDTLKKITGTFLITDSDYDRFCNVFRNDAHIGKERVA